MTAILAEYQQNFNSQPHKEADCDSLNLGLSCKYFNSQPHKEADADANFARACINISTHSLTRRLTVVLLDFCDSFRISTHSLTRRLTGSWYTADRKLLFQLTASQGG